MPRRRCSSPINADAHSNNNNNTIGNNSSNNQGRVINSNNQYHNHHLHHTTHNNLRFRGGRTGNGISPNRNNRLLDTSQETQDCHVSSTTTNLMQEIQSFPIVTALQLQQNDPELEADKKFIMSHPLYPLLALLLQQCELATARPDSPPPLDAFNTELTSYIQCRMEQRQDQQQIRGLGSEEEQVINELKQNSLKVNHEKSNKITGKYRISEDAMNIDDSVTIDKTVIPTRYKTNNSSSCTTNKLSTTTTITTTQTTNTNSSINTTQKMEPITNVRNTNDCFLSNDKVNNDTSSHFVYTTDNKNHKSIGCDKLINAKNNSNYIINDEIDDNDEMKKINCTFNNERKFQFLSNNSELNELIVKAIQVLRIHLLELHKVNELCKDFCSRYIYSLKSKFQSDPLIHDSQPSSPGESEALSPVASGCYNLRYPPPHYHHMSGPNLSCHPGLTDMVLPGYSRHLSSRLDDDSLCGSSDVENLRSDCLHSSSLPNSCTSYDINGSCYTPNFHMMNYNSPYFMDKSIVQDGSVSCDESLSQLHSFLTPYGSSGLTSAAFHASLDGLCVGGKQKRGVLPKRATQIMKQWLFQHLVHPYPTEDEKRQIAGQTNLTLLQVNNWFINARRRILQPMLDSSNFVPLGNNCSSVDGSSDRMSSSIGCNESHVISKKKKAATNRPSNNRFWPASLVAAAAIHPAAAGLVSSGSSSFSTIVNPAIKSTNTISGVNTTASAALSDCHISDTRSNSLDEVNSDTSINSTPKHKSKCGYTPQTYDLSSAALSQSSGPNQGFGPKLSSDLWNLDTRMDLLHSQKFYFNLQSGMPSTKISSDISGSNDGSCNNDVIQNGSNSSSISNQNLSFPTNTNHCLNSFNSTSTRSIDSSQTIPGKYDLTRENLSVKQPDEINAKRLTPLMMSSMSSSSSCSVSKDIDQCTDSTQIQQHNSTNEGIDNNYLLNKSISINASLDNNNLFRSEITNTSNHSTSVNGVKSEHNFQEFNKVLHNLSTEPNANDKMNLLANGLLESNLLNTNSKHIHHNRVHSNTLSNDDPHDEINSQSDVTVPMMMMANSSSTYPQNYSSVLLSHAQTYSNYLTTNMSLPNNLLPFDIHQNNPKYSHANNDNNNTTNIGSVNQLNYIPHSYPNPTRKSTSGFNRFANFSTSNLNDMTVASISTIPLHHIQQQHDSLSASSMQQKAELPGYLTDHQWPNITTVPTNQSTHNVNAVNQYTTFPSGWTSKLKQFSSSVLQNDNSSIDCLSGSSGEDIQHYQQHPRHQSESENGQFINCLRSSGLLNRNEEANTDQSSLLHNTSHHLMYNLPSDINSPDYRHTELSVEDALTLKSVYPMQYDQHHHHHHHHPHQPHPHHHSQYNSIHQPGHISNTCTENDSVNNDDNKTSISYFKSPSTGLLTKSDSLFRYHNS
ncbi:Homeobox protein isoform 1 [Schistosoma japonicum]|uniref:Homeobox protein isoform 1 n=1 Tax=Schistosoma japonicum TaxID=6182 RepID=A0A4Z2CT01_SCHJA|nr:Homeobox protein isoform 1 [Schistosoma japonicum]